MEEEVRLDNADDLTSSPHKSVRTPFPGEIFEDMDDFSDTVSPIVKRSRVDCSPPPFPLKRIQKLFPGKASNDNIQVSLRPIYHSSSHNHLGI